MEQLEKYFTVLLKHLNLRENINVSKINDNTIIVKSNLKISPFIKKLEEVKDQVYRNIQKAVTLFGPNVNVNNLKITYFSDIITITFYPDTYLDLLPNEILNFIASGIDLTEDKSILLRGGILLEKEIKESDLNNFISSVNREFVDYNQIISFKYPTLIKWIILPGRNVTKEEFSEMIKLDLLTPEYIRFLEDLGKNIGETFIIPTNVSYFYIIKMRQLFPHFTGVEFEGKFAEDLYMLYRIFFYNPGTPELLYYILTGKLIGPVKYPQGLSAPHFSYHLISDPLANLDDKLYLLFHMNFSKDVMEAYKRKVTPEELNQLIDYISSLGLGYIKSYALIINKLSDEENYFFKYLLRSKYPHLLEYTKEIPEDKLIYSVLEYTNNNLRLEDSSSRNNIINFIRTGFLDPGVSLKREDLSIIDPYLSYILLINPNFKVDHNDTYLGYLINLFQNVDLFKLYLSKLNKRDIINIVNMYHSMGLKHPKQKQFIEILESYL